MQNRHGHLVCMLSLVIAAALALLVSTPAFAVKDATPTPEYTSWEDLSGATVGMVTGATFESTLREKCPGVGEVAYFSSTSDLIVALQGHKIDAMINSMAVGTLAANRYGDLALFPEALGEYEIGIAFPKGSGLMPEFSAIAERLREDGTFDELWDKWTAGDEGDKTVPD